MCRWDYETKNWTNRCIDKVEYDNNKGTVSFKTSVFGIFGFATFKYINLPFRDWRIGPEKDDSVTVKILAAVLHLQFNIKGSLICLAVLKNSPNATLETIVGKYYKLNRLKRILKEVGVDIFPGMYLLR